MHYSTVLFDLDGTLSDPYEGITRCVAYALEKQGMPVADRNELTCYIGPPLQQGFERFHQLCPADARRAVADYRERFGDIGWQENRVYPGIPELLLRLSASGRQLFVATSKPWYFARRIVAHFGLCDYFGHVYGSELDGQRSEKHALLAHIMCQQSLRARDTVMIGDRRYDIEGARHNGLAAVGVSYGYAAPGELMVAAPDVICDSPQAIAEWLAPGAPSRALG